MQKYIHKMNKLPELFDKLKYESNHYGSSYTAIMFDIADESKMKDFSKFLLKHLRISDTIFIYSETKILVILEETTIRWALILDEKLREKIIEKGLGCKFYCWAVQWTFIDDLKSLKVALEKRIEKAKNTNSDECEFDLSYLD